MIRHSNSTVRFRVIRVLEEIRSPLVIPLLITALRDKEKTVRDRAVEALIQKGKSVVGPLIRVLKKHPSPFTRICAVRVLAKIKDKRINKALLNALTDRNSSVLDYLVDVLVKKGKIIVPGLIHIVKTHKDSGARLYALNTLQKIKDTRVLATFLHAMEDRSHIVRHFVVIALVQKGKTIIPHLVRIIQSAENDVRRITAIRVIAKLKDIRAVKILLKVLSSQNPYVRAEAAWALGCMHYKQKALRAKVIVALSSRLVDDNARVLRSAKRALRKIHNQ